MPKSFGLDRIQQGDLDLTSSGSQQKTIICKRFLQELTWRHYYSSIFCSKYLTLCGWCVRVADLYKLKNFAHFCGHLVASQNFLAHQYQADKKLTFYRWNDSSSCFEQLNQQFLLPWTWISRFRFCRVVSTCTMLRFGTRFGGQLPDRMATLGCWISADSGP